jgi:hypothetical protein
MYKHLSEAIILMNPFYILLHIYNQSYINYYYRSFVGLGSGLLPRLDTVAPKPLFASNKLRKSAMVILLSPSKSAVCQ